MEVQSANVESCYSYGGGKIIALDEDNVAHVSGNGVRILSLSSGSNSFLWNEHEPNGRKSGLSAFAFCSESKQLAIAPCGSEPTVLVYTYPGKRLERTFKSDTKLSYSDVAFSRNGKYLAAIGGLPDYTFTIWDVLTGNTVVTGKLPQPCNFVSFNPLDDTKVVVGGEKGMFFYTISKHIDGITLTFIEALPPVEEDELDELDSEDEEDEDDAAPKEKAPEKPEDVQGPRKSFSCHCWGKDNQVYASSRSGTVALFSHKTGESSAVAAPVFLDSDTGAEDSAIKVGADMLVLTREYLIAGYADSQIRWMSPTTLEVDRERDPLEVGSYNSVFTGVDDSGARSPLAVQDLQPVACSVTPKFSTLVLGTSGGLILSLPLGNTDEDEDADLGPEDTVTMLHAEMHADTVYASCVCVGGPVPLLFNGGVDGSLRVWNSSRRTLVDRKSFANATFLCAGSCPNRPIVAMATTDGVLRIFTAGGTSEKVETKLIYRCKLADVAITDILFHPQKPIVAVSVLSQNQVFFLDVRAEEKIRVIGVARLEGTATPNSLAWRNPESTELFVGSASGDLIEVVAPAPAVKGESARLAAADIPAKEVASVGLKPFTLLATGNGAYGGNQCVFVGSAETKAYAQFDLKSSTRKLQLQPSGRHLAHPRGIICTAMHAIDSESFLVATGGQGGTIVLWLIKLDPSTGKTSTSLLHTLAYHAAPVISLAFDHEGNRLFSSSTDGGIFSWKLERKRRSTLPPVSNVGYWTMDAVVEPTEAECKAELSYLGRLQKIADDRAFEENERAKAVRKNDLQDIRAELEKLLQQNDRVPELEKMNRDEFVIDLDGKASLLKGGEERADGLRKELEMENTKKDLLADRLREEVWDAMDDKTTGLFAFKSNDSIYNFGIPKVTEEERLKLEKVMHVRRVELRHVRTANKGGKAWADLEAQLPQEEKLDWMVNEGLLQPTDDLIERKSEEEKAAEAKDAEKGDDDEEEDEEEEEEEAGEEEDEGVTKEEGILELIYPPLALRTTAQKRIQILFLRELVRLTKKQFNKKFGEIFAMKQDKFDQIITKNNRIKEILGELKTMEEFFVPSWNDEELPEKFSTVTDEEMEIERYVSEAERKRIAEEEEAKRLAGLNNNEDNAPERALMEMMGGTLEVKTDLNALEIELVREEWMDELLFEEMSEDQRKLVEEFEAKQKSLTEEKEKYRKGLELELKKIKAEIVEICQSFDDKLNQFRKVKTRFQEQILTQEMYALRLALLLLEKEDDAAQVTKLRKELVALIEEQKIAKSKLTDFQVNVQQCKGELDVMRNNDKSLEKDFKRIIQERAPNGILDNDTLAVLTTLYKSRPTVQESISKDPSLVMDTIITNDPFVEDLAAQLQNQPGKQAAAARAAAMQPLDLENELPEGFEVEQNILDELQKQRMKKIEHECDISVKTKELRKLQERENILIDVSDVIGRKVQETEALMAELKERIVFNSLNHECLVTLRQGFVEVAQEAVVTDYTDACLINRNLIEERNSRIRDLGVKKVEVLETIKNFNKKINLMKWETNYLKMATNNLEEKYLDLHMLRVTKDLQAFLKGGANVDRHKVDYEKSERKMAYIQKAHAAKMAKLMKTRGKKEKEVKKKESENSRLSNHVKELEKNVAVRASIHRARASGGDGVADPNAAGRARMKAVVTRRKLLDLARAQTDEIEFLRQELDRLRQKTFPSFATRRNRDMNPDEIY